MCVGTHTSDKSVKEDASPISFLFISMSFKNSCRSALTALAVFCQLNSVKVSLLDIFYASLSQITI